MRYPATHEASLRFLVSLVPVMALAIACTHTIEPHRPDVSKSPATPIKLSPRSSERTSPTATALPLAKPVESFLPITLVGDLTALQNAVSAAVPDTFDETRSPLAQAFRWTFQRQGAPQVFLQNGHLMVHADYRGDIELKSGTPAACHLDPVYPTLEWKARLTTTRDGSHVVIRPEASEAAIGLKPDSDGKCNMFAVPLNEQLPEMMNSKEINEQITQAVTASSVAIPIHGLWEQLHGPYVAPLTSPMTPLCIYPDPVDLTLGSVEGTLQQAVWHGEAKVDAYALLTPSCDRPRIKAAKIAAGTPAGLASGRSFILTTMLPISYQIVGQRLQENLFHTEVVLPERGLFGERKVRIDNVSASDGGGQLLLKVETSGYMNGPVYFTGRPEVEGTTLVVPDLHMDIETRRMLDAEKSGLWNQVDQALKDKVRRAARVPLADQMTGVKKAVAGSHKTGDLTLDVAVAQVRPQRVYATPQGLLTEVAIEGKAKADGPMNLQAASSVPTKSVGPKPEALDEKPQDAPTAEQRRRELFETPAARP